MQSKIAPGVLPSLRRLMKIFQPNAAQDLHVKVVRPRSDFAVGIRFCFESGSLSRGTVHACGCYVFMIAIGITI